MGNSEKCIQTLWVSVFWHVKWRHHHQPHSRNCNFLGPLGASVFLLCELTECVWLNDESLFFFFLAYKGCWHLPLEFTTHQTFIESIMCQTLFCVSRHKITTTLLQFKLCLEGHAFCSSCVHSFIHPFF